MKHFARLFVALDETTKTSQKVKVMSEYFSTCSAADGAWTVYLLTGRKLRQLVPSTRLQECVKEKAGLSDWLFAESYDAVGDLAETIALLLPPPRSNSDVPLREWVEERLMPLRTKSEAEQKALLVTYWDELSTSERLVMNKIITGSFRIGVSQLLVIKGLSNASGVDEAAIAHRLMGDWSPTEEFFTSLFSEDTQDADVSRPYPFYLAYPLEQEPEALGEVGDWLAEWKWDGIRSQLIRRQGKTFIWSRGEELITERFPELLEASQQLPDGTVIDGEILAWAEGEVLPFNLLQKRITRKSLSKKLLQEIPVALMAYDILEHDGIDIRDSPMAERRKTLVRLLSPGALDAAPSCRGQLNPALRVSPNLIVSSWEELAVSRSTSRDLKVEGLMLKRADSAYGVGRRKGDWWKWKVNPFSIDAVLIYAQRGHGKRASLYTDYTFGVWHEGRLVPVAKAYSGLDDAEIRQVDAFIRQNTLEKFGPVRTVKPELVFEIAFEGIQHSPRHKSGIAVRFPRIARWRTDKPMEEADSLQTLSALIDGGGAA
ncbi:MAG: ATP-dependent DNA ligase [Candidatus Obscuribacterales bacterium]|nr:ATP-dependent DNA ligase [Candidatus Obscuribacterales bacterium]